MEKLPIKNLKKSNKCFYLHLTFFKSLYILCFSNMFPIEPKYFIFDFMCFKTFKNNSDFNVVYF